MVLAGASDIGINQQHTLTRLGKGYSQIGGNRAFPFVPVGGGNHDCLELLAAR
ncbi:hypothetical protein D3C71_2161490 [compost metagenome]